MLILMSISKNQLKKERLKEVIWYICENYNQQLYETKLWKLAFFCDTDYFQKYEKPLTEVAYIKNKRGPTPVYNIAKEAIGELIENGYIVKADTGAYVAIKEYPLQYLEATQIDAINTTCDKYYKLSVNQICTLAHRDPVYLAAEKANEVLDFSFVAYRDDGGNGENEETEELPKDVTFSEKAQESLLRMLTA